VRLSDPYEKSCAGFTERIYLKKSKAVQYILSLLKRGSPDLFSTAGFKERICFEKSKAALYTLSLVLKRGSPGLFERIVGSVWKSLKNGLCVITSLSLKERLYRNLYEKLRL
jgi:hypothetical protein